MLTENSDISITWEVAGRSFVEGSVNLRQCGVARERDEVEADSLFLPQKANAVY